MPDFDVTLGPGGQQPSRRERAAVIELLVEGADPLALQDGDLLIVGRGQEAVLVLDDPQVSRHHCAFTRRGTSVSLRDLGSTSGTLHNGRPIQECELRDGDRVEVGPFEITVRIEVLGGRLGAQPRGGARPRGQPQQGLPSFSELLGSDPAIDALQDSPPARPPRKTPGRKHQQKTEPAQPAPRSRSTGRRAPQGGSRLTRRMDPGKPSRKRRAPQKRRPSKKAAAKRRPPPGLVVCQEDAEPIPIKPGAKLTVGRHPDCEIWLDDPDVSRRHAQLEWGRDGLWVVDLGSMNGVLLNGKRVEKARVKAGDEIVVGPGLMWLEAP